MRDDEEGHVLQDGEEGLEDSQTLLTEVCVSVKRDLLYAQKRPTDILAYLSTASKFFAMSSCSSDGGSIVAALAHTDVLAARRICTFLVMRTRR